MNRFHFIVGVFSCCLLDFDLLAQNKKSPYERLLETQQEYEAAMKKGDSLEVAEMCYLMGKRYLGLNNFPTAQQWFNRSLRIREPLGLSEDISKLYARMAEIQALQHNPYLVLKYGRMALHHAKHAHSLRGIMGGYNCIAGAHEMAWNQKTVSAGFKGSLDSVFYYRKLAFKYAKKLNNPIDLALSYQFLGNDFASINQMDSSLTYKLKALEIYRKGKNTNNIVEICTEIGIDFLKQKKSVQAKKWIDQAHQLADSTKIALPSQLIKLEEAFALYYEQIRNWRQSFLHGKKSREMKAQQLDFQTNEAIQNTNLIHEQEKRNAELLAQQKEMRLQNKLAIVVFILFLVAVIAGGLFYLLFAKYKKISRENAELVKEQSHRTKNNLQSVSDLLSLELHRLSDPVAVKAMEESLMRVEAMLLLHRGLYQGEKLIEVNLPKYLPDLVKSVLRSYHLEAVKVQYDIEPIWLHTDKAIPLGLIVNELTTNTCKYALKNNPDPQLMLHCFLQTDRLFLRFADNGPGFVSPADKNTFGLRLIGLLMNKLKAKGDFSTANGCCFELSFLTKAAPLNQPKSLKNQPV